MDDDEFSLGFAECENFVNDRFDSAWSTFGPQVWVKRFKKMMSDKAKGAGEKEQGEGMMSGKKVAPGAVPASPKASKRREGKRKAAVEVDIASVDPEPKRPKTWTLNPTSCSTCVRRKEECWQNPRWLPCVSCHDRRVKCPLGM